MDELQYSADLRRLTGTARPLERGVRDGALARVRRGAYAKDREWGAAADAERHLARIAAGRAAAHSERVHSHESAAALHGIPIIGLFPDRVRITVPPGGGKTNGSVIRSQRLLSTADVVELDDGSLATSLVRTAIDIAATRTPLGGIVAMAHVRNSDAIDHSTIADRLAKLGSFPGSARVRRALARSTSGSESALETLIVVRCQDLGFRSPEQQVEIVGIDGRPYRVDFGWRGGRVLLEADGRGKYDGTSDRSGQDVLWAEKRREDAIRPTCDAFLRVVWGDAWHAIELERRLRTAAVPQIPPRRRVLTF